MEPGIRIGLGTGTVLVEKDHRQVEKDPSSGGGGGSGGKLVLIPQWLLFVSICRGMLGDSQAGIWMGGMGLHRRQSSWM